MRAKGRFGEAALGVALVTLLACGAGPARADFLAYSTANATGNQSFTGNLGNDFNVNAPILVTHLGAFDSGQDGFAHPVTVGLFRLLPGASPNTDAAGTLLASVTLSGTSGTLAGNYRFATLPTPLLLPPGPYDIDAVGFSDSDPNGNENIPGFAVSTDDGGGLISFVGTGRFDTTTTLRYPAYSSAHGSPKLSLRPFAGGSFKFKVVAGSGAASLTPLATGRFDTTTTLHFAGGSPQFAAAAAPEPASLTLLATGALGLLGYGWRRRRSSPTTAAAA